MEPKERTSLGDIVKLLRCIERHPEGAYKDIALKLNISESTVKRMRKKVQSLGVVIENLGSRRMPYYSIIDWGMINRNEVTQDDPLDVKSVTTVEAICLEKKHA